MCSAVNLLEILPPEIILGILLRLDAVSLTRCQLVCKFFRDTITQSANLVYTIELAISQQEDGQTSILSPKEKLELLRNQQKHWTQMRWGDELRYTMKKSGLWELFGNVLVQRNLDHSFTFVQLPSTHRNILERTWTVKPERPHIVRDFGIDPSQDLFVLIEVPRRLRNVSSPIYNLHVQTMSAAKKHPLAVESGIIRHSRHAFDQSTSFSIQISGDYVGLFFHDSAMQNEFIIWEWKTGNKKLHFDGDNLLSFSFLSERHVLFSTFTEEGAFELFIVDFIAESSEKQEYNSVSHGLKLALPQLALDVSPLMLTVRSDPSPHWAPHSDLKVPFYASHSDEKIFVASLWLQKASIRHLTFVFTLSALLPRLKTLGPISTDSAIPWEDWGPQATRMDESHRINAGFDTWACYLYGTKLALPEQSGRTSGNFTVHLFDFNPRAVRKAISDGSRIAEGSVSNIEHIELETSLCVTAPSVFRPGDLFEDEIKTWLPYRWISRTIPDANFSSVMCSEDSIIIVQDSTGVGACYRVLSF
ncbi:hypothetical protein D9757_010711 [Collybiopsis confluens]|uniref:F-box domain-containing protein n=1 Tax=Collybiopsis confluens TaxID=2823264 RepID=A0A8H5GZT3_9AGAR|nr:hypothetical protein D9757_010711 [Collybiopsis confluens]